MKSHVSRPSSPGRRAALLALGGAAIAAVLAIASAGFYHDDDAWHFLFALDGSRDLTTLLDFWGRPGYTIPAMAAARLGGLFGDALLATRLLAVAMTGATAWLAWRIARRVADGTPGESFAWLAPALVWLQPVPAQVSFTTLTETAAGLWLTLGLLTLLRGRKLTAGLVLSLVFVTRYELFALGPILGLAMLADDPKRLRSWAGGAVMLWAPAAYLALVPLLDLPPSCSPIANITGPHSAEYGTGGWLHFAALWLLVSGSGIVALAAVGAWRSGRRAWVLTAVVGGTVLLHTVLFRYGLFASGGYARFLVPIAGPTAALAAAGAGFVSRPARSALLALAVLQAAMLVRPFTLADDPTEDGPVEMERARWVRPLAPSAYVTMSLLARALVAAGTPPRLMTAHGFVRARRPEAEMADSDAAALRSFDTAPPGTAFVWDSSYGGEALRDGLLRYGEERAVFRSGGFRTSVIVRR